MAIGGEPLGELVQYPGEGKPDLAYNRDEPEWVSILRWSQDPKPKEEGKDDKPENNDDPVRADFA